nr:TIGR02117 family protein [Flavobacterium sp. NKUCC04_CG]
MGKILVGIILFGLLYFLIDFILSRITIAEKAAAKAEKNIDVYLYSNGVHTDIVMPIRSAEIDWATQIDPLHTTAQRTDMEFLAVGWGDKGFYLETPEWSDLKPSVAFKAAFYLGSSAMHTTFYKKMYESTHCIKVKITPTQYRALISYIQASFDRDSNGNFVLITAPTYGENDTFYEANRTYGLFYTCNTWANNALKAAGMKACFWTAFDRGILYQYSKEVVVQ